MQAASMYRRQLFQLAVLIMVSTNATADPTQDQCGSVPCAKNLHYDPVCMKAIRDQITREIEASVTYLSAASYFSSDGSSRPGTAQMFFDHADEERQHAFKLLHYLLLRGDDKLQFVADEYKPLKEQWSSVANALEYALKLEKMVTSHFTNMIAVCERDWHAADWLTSEMLDEQHRGVRQLAGQITQLNKMAHFQPNLAEFMFDLELLSKQK